MSLDHADNEAVLRFTDDVERALQDAAAGFEPWTLRLLGAWVIAGALLTGAVLADGAFSTILYVLGIAVVAVSVAGFYVARGERARWFDG
jgi:hypothetical protein